MDYIKRMVDRMESCRTCLSLAMRFVCINGKNLLRIRAVADAKNISVDRAADLLLDRGYKALIGKKVKPDGSVPIVMMRKHRVALDGRIAGMKKTEDANSDGRKVLSSEMISAHQAFGTDDLQQQMAFHDRFRDRAAELKIAGLGLSGDSSYEAERRRLEDKRKAAERSRRYEVADCLMFRLHSRYLKGDPR